MSVDLPNSVAVNVPGETTASAKAKVDFTICVGTSFHLSDVNQLVEFIELHRLLGVEIFVFYLFSGAMSNSALWIKCLEFYRESGIVDVYHYNVTKGKSDCVFKIPRLPFAFELESGQLNGNSATKLLPNYHLSDLDKVGQIAKWQFGDKTVAELPRCGSRIWSRGGPSF